MAQLTTKEQSSKIASLEMKAQSRNLMADAWYRLMRNKASMVGLCDHHFLCNCGNLCQTDRALQPDRDPRR